MPRPAVARAKSVSRTGSVRSMRRPGSPSPACSWSGRPEATAIHSRWRSSTGSLSAPPTRRRGEPAPRRAAHLSGSGRLGRERQAVPYARHGGEGDGVRGGAVDGLGEIGEEGLDGARGVGDLLGEQFETDDLVRVGRAGGGHLAGPGQIAGQPGVDQIRRDAAAAQQPAARLQDAEFTAPGEVAGGRAVRFQTEQRRAPAAYREAGLGVEEGGARRRAGPRSWRDGPRRCRGPAPSAVRRGSTGPRGTAFRSSGLPATGPCFLRS